MKKTYTKPTMLTVELRHKHHLLTGSPDAYGMNKRVSSEEVDDAW